MAGSAATLPGGPRLSDPLSIGVLAHVFPRPAVRAALAACGRTSQRRRDLPAEVMVYFVLALGLFRSVSTREVLRCLAEGLRGLGAEPLRIAGRAALSHARKRLGVEPLRELGRRCVRARATAETPGAAWRGLRLRAWDGTTLDVPDEAVHREAFGKPGASRGEAAFPQVRLTALVEVGTRVPLAWSHGPYRESEAAQARRLHDHLASGQLLLADRGYLGRDHWREAAATGAELLWRARRDTPLPVERVLADGSWLSAYGECTVRVVAYALAEAPDETCRLVTTLLDPEAAPGRRAGRPLPRTLGDRDRLRRTQDPHAGPSSQPAQQDPRTGPTGGGGPDAGLPCRARLPGRGRRRGGPRPGRPLLRACRARGAPPPAESRPPMPRPDRPRPGPVPRNPRGTGGVQSGSAPSPRGETKNQQLPHPPLRPPGPTASCLDTLDPGSGVLNRQYWV